MADVPPLTYVALVRKLRKFHTLVRPLLRDCGIQINGNFELERVADSEFFELANCVVLPLIPQRPNSRHRQKKLTVFVHLRGKLDINSAVKSYTTRVSYSVSLRALAPKKVDLVRGVHYDFEKEAKILHPVCHAQEDLLTLRDEINESQYEINNQDYANEHHAKCLCYTNSVRIPTPFMDFFSVIFMLLADHCIDKSNINQLQKFNDLLKMVIDEPSKINIETNYLCEVSAMRNASFGDQHSSHWYVSKI